MAQQLRALTALPGDLGSAPSLHVRQLITSSSFRASEPSEELALTDTLATCEHTPAHNLHIILKNTTTVQVRKSLPKTITIHISFPSKVCSNIQDQQPAFKCVIPNELYSRFLNFLLYVASYLCGYQHKII